MGSKLDELDKENDGPFLQPSFILCEGKSDAAFFFRLVRERNLAGFQVGWANGKTGFRAYLNGMRPRISSVLRRVILVRDSDNDPGAALNDILEQVRAVTEHPYPVPMASKTVATNGHPHVAVLLLPEFNQRGTLESLLIESVRARYPDRFRCVREFAECAGTTGWDVGKLSKMQLASMIAASCPRNPGCSLTTIWADTDNPISLTHDCFNPLSEYLRQFAQD